MVSAQICDTQPKETKFPVILCRMTKWPWKSMSMTPIFNTNRENSKMHMCANLVILSKLSCAYANFPRILSQMVKMSKVVFKFKVSNTNFQYQLRVIHDAYLVQLWWFQLQSVTRYRADKVKFLTNVFLNIHHTVQFFPNYSRYTQNDSPEYNNS